jgi:hypothetical protein
MKHSSTVEVASPTRSIPAASRHGFVTATLVGFSRTGAPLLDIPGEPPSTHIASRSCVSLNSGDVGKHVVIAHDADQPGSPIVIGVIQPSIATMAVEVSADGKRVVVSAGEVITLKCGEASITLNRDGKVVIRGKHVVTHASGVNRIRGGSVQLN